MIETIEIDGSYGEGGGQILRSALSLSLLTGKPFHIKKIRANRNNPGLSNQHVTAIESAQKISSSQVEGGHLRSQELFFSPGKVQAGNYTFSVPTAGAMSLVLHTVYLPLAMVGKMSSLTFYGGTHVLWAPSYEYLEYVWGKAMHKIGFSMNLYLTQAGYFPKGKGEFKANIFPIKEIGPWNTKERSNLLKWNLFCILSSLPEHIAQREFNKVHSDIQKYSSVLLKNKILSPPSIEPGNALFLFVEFEDSMAGFNAIGEKGKSAEKVAGETLSSFQNFWKTNASVDQHLADQLLLPLSFSQKESSYHVSYLTNHLFTNAYIIGLFSKTKIFIEGEMNKPGIVKIQP